MEEDHPDNLAGKLWLAALVVLLFTGLVTWARAEADPGINDPATRWAREVLVAFEAFEGEAPDPPIVPAPVAPAAAAIAAAPGPHPQYDARPIAQPAEAVLQTAAAPATPTPQAPPVAAMTAAPKVNPVPVPPVAQPVLASPMPAEIVHRVTLPERQIEIREVTPAAAAPAQAVAAPAQAEAVALPVRVRPAGPIGRSVGRFGEWVALAGYDRLLVPSATTALPIVQRTQYQVLATPAPAQAVRVLQPVYSQPVYAEPVLASPQHHPWAFKSRFFGP